MKASQLSEVFVKSHNTSSSLRMAWCDATTAFIKRILSDVLKFECKEQLSDEGQVVASESSAEPGPSNSQVEESISEEKSVVGECGTTVDSVSAMDTASNNDVGIQSDSGGSLGTRKHHLDADDEGEASVPRKRTKITKDTYDGTKMKTGENDSSVCDKSESTNGKVAEEPGAGHCDVDSHNLKVTRGDTNEMETDDNQEAGKFHIFNAVHAIFTV